MKHHYITIKIQVNAITSPRRVSHVEYLSSTPAISEIRIT